MRQLREVKWDEWDKWYERDNLEKDKIETSEQVQQDKWTCKIRETSSINDTSEIIKTSKTCKAITEHSNLVGS